MNVYIKLTIAGTDTGPFDLYSDDDGFISPFETGLSRDLLINGYISTLVPNDATQVKVQSTGNCSTSTIIDIEITTTSTTSTTTTHFHVYTHLGTISSYSSSSSACEAATCNGYYYTTAPTLANDLILYDDAGLTIPHDGGGQWIALNNDVNSCYGTWCTVQVDSYGVISNLTQC